jgi:hypothetical protein
MKKWIEEYKLFVWVLHGCRRRWMMEGSFLLPNAIFYPGFSPNFLQIIT